MKRHICWQQFLLAMVVVFFPLNVCAKTVTLSWDPSPSTITGYKIYYAVNSSTVPLEGTGATEGDSPIDVGNVLTFTINGLSDADDHYFAVTATDGTNESVYSNTVHSPPVTSSNSAPELSSIGNKSVLENALLNFTVIANDADGDALTYGVENLPDGAGFNSTTGQFSWTPNFTQSGLYNLVFSVTDGTASDSEAIQITVTDVVNNQPPVLNPIGTQTIGEGSQLIFTISGSDPDGDALTYSVSELPAGSFFNPTTRLFNWIPDFDDSVNTRVYPVTFTVSDGLAQDSETVTINVTHVNRAPTLEAIGSQSMTEWDSFNLVVSGSDPDNDALTYSATGLPEGAVFTPSTRSFSWIPDINQAGIYQVVFSVTDGLLSATETVTMTVLNANEAPVLAPVGSQSVSEGELLSFALSATDVNGDPLSYNATELPSGAAFDNATQRFSWTPDYDQAGNFTVEFNVSDGTLSDSESVSITVSNTNRPPTISGSAVSSVMATTAYQFVPTAGDPDGDSLTFSIENKPSWAVFDADSGALSGTPDMGQTGTYPGITITVSDAAAATSLPAFAIEVTAYVAQDSDGDGVLDHLDAFPDDPAEWEDTDGDQLGNNADPDDDNDGVADIRDGFPLDNSRAGWVITATAGTGGYINPDGETTVLYGGSQAYELTPLAGYYMNDLLVDGVSVGLMEQYEFINIDDHHQIEGVFAPIPTGLSYDPLSIGLIGVDRVDGGDDANNLVDNKPKQDLDYRFTIVLRDSAPADQRRVYLVLNSYKYQLQLENGALSTGAEYALSTRLGPAHSHQFHFVAEDLSGTQLWRYPASGDLPGPIVELLDGRNVIGMVADINAYGLDALEAFEDKIVYRWIADSGPNGSFKLADTGAPIASGEGYVLKKAVGGTLPDRALYGEITEAEHEIQLNTGWNLISNPYGGRVDLRDVGVRVGAAAPQGWLDAVARNLVVDAVYSYLGEDWGDTNEFASAGGSASAYLIPWIGYWIYVNPNEEPVSLVIPKPLQ
ncbi:MAG: tandem-95 repeat protein [Desulfuromonadales bacterium]|nr:tandem-95 repeat protein [Desulfuromonadales bacterium]MBN2791204.1 tandem-95 repeat protein [Desulfuromonadales bacterium]